LPTAFIAIHENAGTTAGVFLTNRAPQQISVETAIFTPGAPVEYDDRFIQITAVERFVGILFVRSNLLPRDT